MNVFMLVAGVPPSVNEVDTIPFFVLMNWFFEDLVESVNSVFDLSANIFDFILENPVLIFLLAASIVPVGFKIFRGMKRTCK